MGEDVIFERQVHYNGIRQRGRNSAEKPASFCN